MPILDMQKSLRRLGRIRMGNQVETSDGRMRPNKLANWRITSASQELLLAAAERYGGEVHPWAGAPTGQQWELMTESDTLEAMIPPGEMAFQQFYELWSGGGCSRRCDGFTESMSGEACLCPSDPDEKQRLAGKGKACKPTTRLFVVLPYLPDVGMWHMEAHGYYAATEIPGTLEVIRMASANGNLVPTKLRIDQRSVKRDGKTINFAVPVIELPTLTTHTLMTGEVSGELGSGLREIGAGSGDTPPAEDQPPAPVESGSSPSGAGSASSRGARQPSPAEPDETAPARTRSPGEKLHRELGRLGFKDRSEHEELIFNASGGRTVRASELDEKERAAATAMAQDVVEGRVVWAKVAESNDAHRAGRRTAEVGRPLPGPGTGDGSKFRRAILTKAERSGLDGDALESLAQATIGKSFAQVDNSADANALMAAVS